MIDIKQTAEGDLDLSMGDIAFANEFDATEQHKADILYASQGDYKESPLTGVGIMDYINSEDNDMMRRDISIQMQKDGIKINKVGVDQSRSIIIDGRYEDNNSKG